MNSNVRLDEKDRQIITLFQKNPEISQSEIAEIIGLSQPSVGMRIKKLKDRGILSHIVGMNFKKVNLFLAKVEIAAKNSQNIIDTFSKCPFFINALMVSGRYNMTLLFMGENIATLESIVDYHLRQNPDVKEVDFNIIVSPVKDLVMPVKITLEGERGCDLDCDGCPYYKSGRCLGCPATSAYKGDFWRKD